MDENGLNWPSKRVWKMVESQGKVGEKSGNFEMDIEWQPCTTHSSISLRLIYLFLLPGALDFLRRLTELCSGILFSVETSSDRADAFGILSSLRIAFVSSLASSSFLIPDCVFMSYATHSFCRLVLVNSFPVRYWPLDIAFSLSFRCDDSFSKDLSSRISFMAIETTVFFSLLSFCLSPLCVLSFSAHFDSPLFLSKTVCCKLLCIYPPHWYKDHTRDLVTLLVETTLPKSFEGLHLQKYHFWHSQICLVFLS